MRTSIQIDIDALSSDASTYISKYFSACGEEVDFEKVIHSLHRYYFAGQLLIMQSGGGKEIFTFIDRSKIFVDHETQLITVK